MCRSGIYLALALMVVSAQAFAQNRVDDWFPMRVGYKWIHQNESRDGAIAGFAHPDIHRWRTEETIVSLETVAEGALVVRRIRDLDPAPADAYEQHELANLIRNDCVYGLRPPDWRTSDHQLTPEFRKSLLAREASPDFCFPLSKGKSWGPENEKYWKVTEAKQQTFHIVSVPPNLGSGMTADIWYERGVGVVRVQQIHHGTYWEDRIELLRFDPASRH